MINIYNLSLSEKLHIKVVGDTGTYTGIPYGEDKRDIEKAQQQNKQFLSIPRRCVKLHVTIM